MSAESSKVIRMCLDSEIEATEREIKRTGPKRDHWGSKLFDIREQHLARLTQARRELLND